MGLFDWIRYNGEKCMGFLMWLDRRDNGAIAAFIMWFCGESILRIIKSSEGVTLRQIARVTGLNVMNVQKA